MDDASKNAPTPAKKSHLLRHILTGFFAIAPLYVTWWVFQFMFGLLANAGKPLVSAAASTEQKKLLAQRLGISSATLYRKLQEYSLLH